MHIRLLSTLAAVAALSGCAPQRAAPPVAVDLQNEGIAKTCAPSTADPALTTPATIAMSNDGWCGVFATEQDGKAFNLGLLRSRPTHGRVFIQKVNDRTRIEYTPFPGYVGADSFTVALRSRTAATPDVALRVDVAVAPGNAPVAAPAAAQPTPPARQPTTRTRPPARRPAA